MARSRRDMMGGILFMLKMWDEKTVCLNDDHI